MADNANNKELPPGEAPPKKSKFKRFLIFFLIFLILLAAGGGGAYWWFYLRKPPAPSTESNAPIEQQAEGAQSAAPATGNNTPASNSPRIERPSVLPRSAGHVLPLPPFVVNLSDSSGKRYLRLGMEVEVNQDVSSVLKSQEARVRDAVIVLLAGKTFADISTAEGKILLKAEVAARLNQILGGAYVVRVYFTEFVVE